MSMKTVTATMTPKGIERTIIAAAHDTQGTDPISTIATLIVSAAALHHALIHDDLDVFLKNVESVARSAEDAIRKEGNRLEAEFASYEAEGEPVH
jgi:hypothetical protein